MSRLLAVGFAFSVAFSFSAKATVRAQPGWLGQQAPLMTVRLYDYSDVPPEVLERAIPHAERILRRAGVEVAWTGCKTAAASLLRTAACNLPAQPDHILLRFVSPSMDRIWDGVGAPPFGYALPDAESGIGSVVSVFYHRTEELIRQVRSRSEGRVFSASVVLGHVIAHEIGHLLLGAKGHSQTGIMQSPLGREQLQAMLTGDLLFTKKQSQRIRQNVRRRIAAAKPPEAAR